MKCDASTTTSSFQQAIVGLYPSLVRHARRLVGLGSDAEDLVQDTVEKALRSRAKWAYGSSPDRWVHAILSNRFIDGGRQPRGLVWCETMLGEQHPSLPPALEPWWQSLEGEDVQAALGQLSPSLREVFIHREVKGHSYAQISASLGISCRTAGTRLWRARQKLRHVLETRHHRP
ncbi:MAG TPA: RNA polymerase sigma factor [Polyangia bacterium]